MTDFGGHLKIGLVVSGGVAVFLIAIGQSPLVIVVGTVIALLSSLLPDIDVHSSIPRKWLGILFLGAFPILAIYTGVAIPWTESLISGFVGSLVDLGRQATRLGSFALLAVIGIIGAIGAGKLIDNAFTHRGITHSPLFAVVGGTVVTFISQMTMSVSIISSVVLGGVFTLGIFDHVYIGDN